MAVYAPYSTVTNVRTAYLSSTQTGRDTTLLDLIESTSREMDAITNRKFYPYLATQYLDAPTRSRNMYPDGDLLSITTLTNGDSTAIASTEYKLYPLNDSVKNKITMLMSTSTPLVFSTGGDPEGAISLTGEFGYCTSDRWTDTGAVLTGNQAANATTFVCTTGKVLAGDLVKIGSEYMQVGSVVVAATDTATVVRAVNGSTAAAHTTGDVVYRFTVAPEIEMTCRMAVAAYFRLKDNPIGESITIDNASFSTPKDVFQWLTKRLQGMGVVRTGTG